MTDRTCPSCGGRSVDGHLCHDCTKRTRRALRQIAEWWPSLEETITRQARLHAGAAGGAIFRPLPFDDAVSKLAHEVHADLVGWVRIAVEGGAAHPERGDTPFLALHLIGLLPDLRTHEDAAELTGLSAWPARIREAVDYPDERGKIKVGPCPERIDEEPCAGTVWARFFEDARPSMTCEPPEQGVVVCGASWPAGEWERPASRILARLAEQQRTRDLAAAYGPKAATVRPPMPLAAIVPLVTVADAALIYGVPEGTVRRWLSEGKLWPFGSRSSRLVSAWQVADRACKDRRHPTLLGPLGPADPVSERTLRGTIR